MQYCYIMGWYGEALEAGQRTAKLIQFIGQWYEEAGTPMEARFFLCAAPVLADISLSCVVVVAEFYYMYSLSLLAACKGALEFISPKERVREQWIRMGEDTANDKRESRIDRRRQRKRGMSRSRSKSGLDGIPQPPLPPLPPTERITKEQFQEYLEIVAHNQEQMKRWADSAACNFQHQYLLVEVPLTARCGNWCTLSLMAAPHLPHVHHRRSVLG
jgi:hypothetical protein